MLHCLPAVVNCDPCINMQRYIIFDTIVKDLQFSQQQHCIHIRQAGYLTPLMQTKALFDILLIFTILSQVTLPRGKRPSFGYVCCPRVGEITCLFCLVTGCSLIQKVN